MSQEEDSSPPNSPPSSQSQDPLRHRSSSQWDLPPDTNPANSFKYKKATPAGLASGGGKAQNGETSARAAGMSASRGLGSVAEGSKSGGAKSGAAIGATGMSLSRDGRAGREQEVDDDDETRENEQRRMSKTVGSDGDEQGVRKGSFSTGEQQQQRKEKSTGATPRPSKSPTSATAGDFASRFRLGQPGVGSFQQQQRPPSASTNPAINKLPAPQQFLGSLFGRSTPPSSQIVPVNNSTGQQIYPPLKPFSHPNPASRSSRAPPDSRSTVLPFPPPPLHSSHPSAQHQQPVQPHRPTAPLSPAHGQARGGQHQENNRPSTTTRDGAANGGGGATNSKKRLPPPNSGEVEIPRTDFNSSVRAGGDGSRAPRADGSPSAKKRKGEKGAIGIEDVFATISSYKTQSEKKDAELVSLRARLADKDKEVERLRGEKDTLKGDAIGKVNLALSRLETTRKELYDVSLGMRAAATKLETEMGSPANLAELRDELNTTKQLFQRKYLDVDGNLWLERNEESKIAALRALQTEIQQRQEVINLLRDQLVTKTGEIVEARDRIAQLEQLQSTHHLASADLELLRMESRSREDDLREKRVEAENRLDEALLKGRDREAALEEKHGQTKRELEDKIEGLRKELEDARVTISASDTETTALSALNLRLEKELKESSTEIDSLKTKLETLDLSFNETRSNARAEEERLEKDLNGLRLKNSEQEGIFSRQAAELEQLRPLSSQLTKVKIDLDVAKQKLITDAAAAFTLLEGEKLVSRDLNSRNDTLVTQLHAKEAQLVKESTRLSESQNKVKTDQSLVDTLQLREKEFKVKESELTAELEQARAELSATQQSHQRHEAQAESRIRKQVDDLQLQITTLKAANDVLAREKQTAEQRIGELKNVVSTMEDAKASADSDARRLQQELSLANAARDSLLHFEGELAQVKRDQAAMLQNRIKETVASCQEGHSREKAQLSNELKRANNKLEELTTRNQKLSTELAKSKNRPMIDPHIASSSPAVSPARGNVHSEQEELGAEQGRPQQAPTSDDSSAHTFATTTLSAIDAMNQEQSDEELTAGIDEELTTGIDEEVKPTKPKKEDKRVSSASTVQAALAPPIAMTVKKDKSKSAATTAGFGAGAQSTSRALRTTRRRTMDPEQDDRNGDEDKIEDVNTQIGRPEDEIEDVTQVNRAGRDKGRPTAKTTYSRKRKDVKR